MAVGTSPTAIRHVGRPPSKDGGWMQHPPNDRRDQRDQRGASAVEYGLLVAGIAAVICLAVYAFGLIAAEVTHDNCTHITGATQSTIQTSCD